MAVRMTIADTVKSNERERAAMIAEGLADRWEAAAQRVREEHTRRFFWLGPKYVLPEWESRARMIDDAAHGLRAVAEIIRDPDVTIESVKLMYGKKRERTIG